MSNFKQKIILNNKNQELKNNINREYEKLSEVGKNAYLDIKKKKLKKHIYSLISFFGLICITLFISGFLIDEGQLYIFAMSGVFLFLGIFSFLALHFELKQPKEKLIKSEIKQRLLPSFQKKVTDNIWFTNSVTDDFQTDKIIKLDIDKWSNSAILIDNKKKKFIYKKGENLSKQYSFNDIINYEVYENGNSQVKGTAGKAMIGGAFFGLGGLIVGSSMGKRIDEKCNQLHLIIRLNDLDTPQIDLKYIDNIEYDKESSTYRTMKSNIQQVCSILEYMINNKTLEESSIKDNKQNDSTKTNKEQLKELKEMLEEDLITQEEYEKKKKQILGL